MPTNVSPVHSHRTLPVHLTQHARCRSAQRAIPFRVVEQLLAAGKRDHDRRGGIRIHLHHRHAQQDFARLTSAETLAQYRNAYAVVACNDPRVVITVGWCELTGRTDPSPRRHARH